MEKKKVKPKRRRVREPVVCGIYMITTPFGSKYIGKSTDIYELFAKYRRLDCKTRAGLYTSLRKHGVDKHKFEILAVCEDDKAAMTDLEDYYLEKYAETKNKRGRNRRSKEPIICGIYKITSPTGRIYIGQSLDCYERREFYSRVECKAQTLVYRSIKKHGWAAHKWEIIEVLKPIQETLDCREKHWIAYYKSWDTKYGLNLQDGGYNGRQSAATRKKIGISSTNRKRSPESIEKGRLKMIGRKASPESIENMRRAQKNRKRSKEEIERWSKIRIGRPSAMKGVTGKDHHCSKPVYCVELDKSFASAIEATAYLKQNGFPKARSSTIGGVCQGRQGIHGNGYKYTRRKAYGYTWRFIIDGKPQEFTIEKPKRITPEFHKQSISQAHLRNPPICKPVYCPELNMTFRSGVDAAKYLKKNGFPNASSSSISEICHYAANPDRKPRKNKRMAYGLSWEFILDGTYYEKK